MMHLKKNKMVTVKKFSASWCGPCRALAPVMNEVKTQFSNVLFEDIDVDESSDIASKYNIRSVPTVVIERDGKELHRFAGAAAKMTYVNALNESLK
jgi:thioredoxin 1